MDTVKGKLLSLESKVKDIESRINTLTGSTPMIEKENHAVFPSEEFIESNLVEELQTLKFGYIEKTDHGKTGKKYYEYSLLNATKEIEEIVNIYDRTNTSGGTSGVVLLSFCDSPEKIEEYGYEIVVQGTNPPLSNEKNRIKLKQELDKYFFQVARMCDTSREDFRGRPTLLFSQDITIQFRNEYERLPHISYYLTPIQECSKVKIVLKDLTKNQAVFTFTQKHIRGQDRHLLSADRYEIPTDIKLHLYVKGIQKKESIDLLLE